MLVLVITIFPTDTQDTSSRIASTGGLPINGVLCFRVVRLGRKMKFEVSSTVSVSWRRKCSIRRKFRPTDYRYLVRNLSVENANPHGSV